MPTLFRGVQWSAYLSDLRCVSSVLQPLPLLYRGLLLGASLHMPTLFRGIQWSAYLSGLCRASSVLQLLPFCDIEGFFLELLLHMPVFISGHPVECLSTWPLLCDLLFATFYLGCLLGLSSDWSPFHLCFSLLELSFGCVSSSLIIQSSWVLAFSRRQHIFAFIAGLFKDKVYPLLISSWHWFCWALWFDWIFRRQYISFFLDCLCHWSSF